MNPFADFENRHSRIANLKSEITRSFHDPITQSLNHQITRSSDHPMTSRFDQEELTLLLDEGRNIYWLCRAGGDAPLGGGWVCPLQEWLYSPLKMVRSVGGAPGFVHFHVNRSHLLLMAPTAGRLALLRAPWRGAGPVRFWRGPGQRLAEFHHLSLKAFRQWPRVGGISTGGEPGYTQSPEGCVTVEGRHR